MSSTELRDGLYCCKKTISSCTARYGCYELLLSSLVVKCKTLDARIQHLVDLNREAQVRMNTLEQGHMRNLEVRRPVVTPAASPKVLINFVSSSFTFSKGKSPAKIAPPPPPPPPAQKQNSSPHHPISRNTPVAASCSESLSRKQAPMSFASCVSASTLLDAMAKMRNRRVKNAEHPSSSPRTRALADVSNTKTVR